MPRHLIGDAHEWINEIPTVPTHSLAKLQPSQRSWDLYCVSLCHMNNTLRVCRLIHVHSNSAPRFGWAMLSNVIIHYFKIVRTTAGQEDPFELDSNLLLSSGRHGEDRKRQYIYCTTMKHRYLTIWLTYCISIASLLVLVKHTPTVA